MKKTRAARFIQCGKPKKTEYGILRCVYSKGHKSGKCSWEKLLYEQK